MRGARPELQTFDVRLGLDPSRVALWELVLDLEELNSDGDLVAARRVRLLDLELPEHGAEIVTVKLPTLGRRLTRRVRLFDLNGRLLDAAEAVRLFEQVQADLSVIGAASTSIRLGDNSMPNLLRRLEALDRSEQEHIELLAAGMPQRIITNAADGRNTLAERLAAAREELLIFDPFFGKDAADWDLLRKVPVRVRVLTSGKIGAPLVRPGSVQVTCRAWRHSKAHPVPFHDRGYVWRGGGLWVGTSPNHLGNRITLIDVMEPAVVARMTQLFESWWADERARAIEPS